MLGDLKSELPNYLVKAAGIDVHVRVHFDPLEWWRCLVQPSSAAAECVVSLLKAAFRHQQDIALNDYIHPSLMLQYNHY